MELATSPHHLDNWRPAWSNAIINLLAVASVLGTGTTARILHLYAGIPYTSMAIIPLVDATGGELGASCDPV
jgi:hypothetical protein